VTGAEGGLELAPLRLPVDDRVHIVLRAIVRSYRPGLRAAFVYRRRPAGRGDGQPFAPTVGLLPGPVAPDQRRLARHVADRVGRIHGDIPTIVLVAAAALRGVLEVATPVGAGGMLEDAVEAARAGGPDELVLLVATLADATVTVPVPADLGAVARPLRAGDAPRLPVITDTDGRRCVLAFSSDLAALATHPTVPGALRLPGAVLALALPPDTDVLVDPGTAQPYRVDGRLLKAVAGVKT
jgi:hypothetical protein